ncbi:MAG: adenylate/guanylate cyclase domain-containing protein [Granulosicoccaceae bacterium]
MTSYNVVQAALLLTVYVLFLLIASGVLQIDAGFGAQIQTRDISGNVPLVSFSFGSMSLLPYETTEDSFGGGLWGVQLALLVLVLCLPACNAIAAILISVISALAIVVVSWLGGAELTMSLVSYGWFSVIVFLTLVSLVSVIEQMLAHERMWKAFKQYVPPAVAAQYSAQQESRQLGNESRELSILFCDIHGFSSLSEQLEPARLSHLLNRYFDMVSDVIVKHNGTIDKFMGDAVMAFWGAPQAMEDHAERAVLAAIEIQQNIDELAKDWRLAQLPSVKVGVGVATGPSFVGHLGSHHRMSYTVIGDTVNTAQRLEKATREYRVPIIVSQATVAQAGSYIFRKLDTIQVSGKHQFLTIFEPTTQQSQMSEELSAEMERHHHALKFFQQRRWDEASKLFLQLRDSSENKEFYEAYLHRIDRAQENERPAEVETEELKIKA